MRLGAVLPRSRNVRLEVLLEEGRESPKAGPWWEKKIQSCTGEERRRSPSQSQRKLVCVFSIFHLGKCGFL